MDSVEPQLDDLTSSIDNLEASLAPLLSTTLSTRTSKLPLLDKAKLYVLAAYAVNSILFSSLRLNGVDVRSHPVSQELNRVKEYFGKIQTAEKIGAGGGRAARLDRDAAQRFVKHGLAGNEKVDRERLEKRERERAGAKRKLEEMSTGTHTRFDDAAGKRMKGSESQTVKVVRSDQLDDRDDEEDSDVEMEDREDEFVGSAQQGPDVMASNEDQLRFPESIGEGYQRSGRLPAKPDKAGDKTKKREKEKWTMLGATGKDDVGDGTEYEPTESGQRAMDAITQMKEMRKRAKTIKDYEAKGGASPSLDAALEDLQMETSSSAANGEGKAKKKKKKKKNESKSKSQEEV